MFAPCLVEAKSVGEDVVLSLGSWHRTLHFETAVLLASWLDECARNAKLWAEDTRRLFKGVGTLHDASDHKWIMADQPFTPGKDFHVINRDSTLKKHDIAVHAEGAAVVLLAGDAMATIPYQAALQISQFIRLKAKESQTRAGDVTRHWSKITQEHAAQLGPGITRG